jgi:nitrate/nitrite transporter NarK
VTIIDDFQNTSNAFVSTFGSSVAFASSLTINLNIDFFANPGDAAFRVGLSNAWIEKYKAL